jgi:hypothetical protein
MLKQGNRYLFFFIVFTILSCKNIESHKFDFEIYEIYKSNNFHKYRKLNEIIKDTLNEWIVKEIKESKYYKFNPWQIDSVLIFNIDSSRVYTTLNKRDVGNNDAIFDYINELLGAKIDGQWYFYPGGNYVVPRQNYQDSMYAPLTFEELSYVAHKRPMAGMLLRDKDGKVVVNHERMNDRFFAGDGDFHKCNKVQSCYDSVIIEINKSMHTKKLDPEEVEDIKFSMASSVRPEEPFLPSRAKKEKSWWDILTKNDPEVKIFESEEWKNRHKKEK